MNELPQIRTVDLKGNVTNDNTGIEILRAELSPEGGPFAVVRYAIDGKEQTLGLRLDLDKGVFLDELEGVDKQKAKAVIAEIITCIASGIASGTSESPLSEKELEGWIDTHAKYSAQVRKARSQPVDMKDVEHYAEQALAFDILDGRINFARRLAPTSYYRLETVWLWEVKCVKAYLIWEDRHGGVDPTCKQKDYDNACEHIRNLLKTQVKGTISEFQIPKSYLMTKYLRSDGKIDEEKCKQLILDKIERIKQKTGETEEKTNRENAIDYLKKFYENIIPAVEEDNPDNVLAVLNAFKFSKAQEHRILVINSFEAALAIYFLNPETIKGLINAGLIDQSETL